MAGWPDAATRCGYLLGVLAAVVILLPASVAARPRWVSRAGILVASNPTNLSCRTGVCKHNENTDLIWWHRAIYLVHRTANSQVLGRNSSLRVYRSLDRGRSFRLQAIIPAPTGRDIRDPCFFIVGRQLFIKAITRLPGFALRDPVRRIDQRANALTRRAQLVPHACDRPGGLGLLASGETARRVLRDGV